MDHASASNEATSVHPSGNHHSVDKPLRVGRALHQSQSVSIELYSSGDHEQLSKLELIKRRSCSKIVLSKVELAGNILSETIQLPMNGLVELIRAS